MRDWESWVRVRVGLGKGRRGGGGDICFCFKNKHLFCNDKAQVQTKYNKNNVLTNDYSGYVTSFLFF